MSLGTLGDIITKTRELTGTGNSLQLTDAKIIEYINSFYLYDFPAQFRSLELKNTITINTIQNLDTYPLDQVHYTTIQAPAWIEGRVAVLYTSPWPFYEQFFNWQKRETFSTGDGTAGAYTGTCQNVPIVRSTNNNPQTAKVTSNTSQFPTGYPPSFSEPVPQRVQNLLISANTATGSLHVTDNGNGNLIGDCLAGSTINYTTGAISVTFTATIPSGADIDISYNPANANRPQAILFFQNEIVLRPVPDKAYQVVLTAYRRPSQALLGTTAATNMNGQPELFEWWEALAFGAAKKIYESRQDMEGVAMMDKGLAERYDIAETRTYAQLGSQVIQTIHTQQLYGIGSLPLGWGSQNG